MFSKVLIVALAAAVANSQLLNSHFSLGGYSSGLGLGAVGGLPVYKSSANYGGLVAANGWGYGANLGRIGGLGALRTTGAIVGGGALGYGTGALVAPGYGYAAKSVYAAPAISTVGVAHAPAAIGAYGIHAKGLSVHQAGPVNAAVHTVSRTVDYRPVPYTGEPAVVQDIDVAPQESPLRINFQSKSSPLQVTQQHIPAEPGQVQVTQSEDEPQTAIHNVVRPVVQQVNEVVQPYRSLTQTVEPVIEQTHTNIAQGEGVRLTGLQSGVIGGTGVLAASGLGVAAPAVSTVGLAGIRTAGLGLAGYGTGLGYSKVAGLGLGYGSGLYGARSYGVGYGTGLIGARGYGLGYGSGLIGARSYGLGGGLALNGLSGLSGYGTTATKVISAY